MKTRARRRLESRFPPSLFGLYLVTLLLMSGIHIGLVTLINENPHWHTAVQILIPTAYWTLVAVGLTLFTRYQIAKTYDKPMKELAKAADKVAHGDFSVYIPPLHTSNRHDYLDLMFLDFNKMVAELGSIETMRTDFIANVSHEIKTPLAAIQNYTQLLQRPGLSPSERDAYLAAIQDSTRRLSELITNILKLNKLESQQITPRRETYDLCRQLSECALAFEPVWEEKGIRRTPASWSWSGTTCCPTPSNLPSRAGRSRCARPRTGTPFLWRYPTPDAGYRKGHRDIFLTSFIRGIPLTPRRGTAWGCPWPCAFCR